MWGLGLPGPDSWQLYAAFDPDTQTSNQWLLSHILCPEKPPGLSLYSQLPASSSVPSAWPLALAITQHPEGWVGTNSG